MKLPANWLPLQADLLGMKRLCENSISKATVFTGAFKNMAAIRNIVFFYRAVNEAFLCLLILNKYCKKEKQVHI